MLSCINLYGQTRTVQGRVLSEELEPLPGLEIRNSNDFILGKADMTGHFKINIDQQTDSLFLSFIAMEQAKIRISDECDLIELIIMDHVLYHEISSKKIDRLRRRRFEDLSKKHIQAVDQGLFTNNQICYERTFVPAKPQLDRIKNELEELDKETLNHFKELEVGDILKIPLGFDSSGKSVNTYYSICGDCTEEDYDFIIEAELIDKRKKHLNLELKILDMGSHDLIEYEGKTLKIGDTFKYQMKYFEVIIN